MLVNTQCLSETFQSGKCDCDRVIGCFFDCYLEILGDICIVDFDGNQKHGKNDGAIRAYLVVIVKNIKMKEATTIKDAHRRRRIDDSAALVAGALIGVSKCHVQDSNFKGTNMPRPYIPEMPGWALETFSRKESLGTSIHTTTTSSSSSFT